METKSVMPIVAVLISLLWACSPSTASADLVDDAKAKLAKDDPQYQINETTKFFYNHFGDARLSGLLRAVWDQDKKKYPDLAWRSLADEEVRLKFASLWAQWVRENQPDKREIDQIRKFVLPYRDHPDRRLRMQAVSFTVGATEKDVEKLREIVLRDERLVAALAVYSIVSIQGKRARETLSSIRDQVKDPSLQITIDEAIQFADRPTIYGNRQSQ